MLDEIMVRFFDDEDQYKKAMNILGRYNIKAVGDWQTVEAFLTTLGSYDSHLLEQAIDYNTVLKKEKGVSNTQPALATDNDRIGNIERSVELLAERHTPLDSKPLTELVDMYMGQLQEGWKAQNIATNTRDIKPKLELFAQILGDIDSKEIKPDHIVTFKSTLSRLPSNRTKGIYADKSIKQLLKMDVPESDKLAGTTIKNYAGKVSSFLSWMAKNNYCNRDLNDPLKGIRTPDKADHEERPIFSPNQLTHLFESKEYVYSGHKKPSHYWVPLLALFTGARQNEICQLYKEDIRQYPDTDIWVIDINEKGDKKLKNPHSARLIPVHKQLIEIGMALT